MKKYVYMILGLLLILPAYATVDVSSVKVYVEDVITTANEDGGNFNAFPGDLVEWVIALDNTKNETATIDIKGIIESIDDGDDLDKTLSQFTIDANDDRKKTLSFLIPDDARKDNYDMVLSIDAVAGNTTNNYDIDYVIEVEVKEIDVINLEATFNNLTLTCNSVISSMSSCFGYINRSTESTDELSTCREERGTCQSQRDEFERTKNSCNDEKVSLNNKVEELNQQIRNKDSQLSVMITPQACTNSTNAQVAQAKTDTQNFWLMAVAACGVVGFIFWQKKKKENVAGAFNTEIGRY